MKMTEEQLKALVADQAKAIVEAANVKFTEDIKGAVDEKVKALMAPGGLKPFLPAPDPKETPDGKGDFKCGFKTMTEFAHSVYKAELATKGYSNAKIDQRLLDIHKQMDIIGKGAGTPAMEEMTPDAGGYLIPPEFRATLMEVAIQNSNIMSQCMLIPMAVSSVNIPYLQGFDRSAGLLFGGISFDWIEEEAEITGRRPKIGQIGMRLRKCVGMSYVSNEMLEDSPISIEPLLSRMFQTALTWTMDWVLINGTGAGQPRGIYNSPCLVTVSKELLQAADTVVYENVLNMYARMWSKANMAWFANDAVLPQLGALSLAVGLGGQAVFLPAGGASQKPYDSLMGRPIYYTEHCRALGDKGDIYACDWTQYLIGQKAGMAGGTIKFDTSMHLKFDFDQMAFRITFRVDGQPWWPTALTPRYGGNTLSPFICMEAR
jgi:HK97 family phage major capsid protein